MSSNSNKELRIEGHRLKWPEEKEERERRVPSFWEFGRVAPGPISRHLTQPELDLFRILGSFNFFVLSHLHYFLDYSNLIVYCHASPHLIISHDQARGTEYVISAFENSLGNIGVPNTSQPGVAFFSVTLRIFTPIFPSSHTTYKIE